jgi:DNA-binding response OmpR family regulator
MLKDKLVLLVDDEPSMLNTTRLELMDRGFNVQAVSDAEDALKAIQALKPSIVISDLVMPGINGFELFEQVKNKDGYGTLPFVFLTAVDDYYAKKFGKQIGGAAYITKPVDIDELEKVIRDKIGE